MTRCKGCGEQFRKGKLFHLAKKDGTIVPVVGCQDCAKRALKVVTPIGEMANLCTICETSPARICSGCAVKARRELVLPILAQLHGLARGHDAAGNLAQADGMRSAIRALEQQVERS